MPDAEVRRVTASAVQAARDPDLSLPDAAGTARGVLVDLPGFRSGDALASALLTAAAPTRMAVYDGRAHAGLAGLGIVLPSRRRYRTYLAHLAGLLRDAPEEATHWLPRDVDVALYMLGAPGTNSPTLRAQRVQPDADPVPAGPRSPKPIALPLAAPRWSSVPTHVRISFDERGTSPGLEGASRQPAATSE